MSICFKTTLMKNKYFIYTINNLLRAELATFNFFVVVYFKMKQISVKLV